MKQFAYVGCRTTKERNARGKGIRIFEIERNLETGWTFRRSGESVLFLSE